MKNKPKFKLGQVVGLKDGLDIFGPVKKIRSTRHQHKHMKNIFEYGFYTYRDCAFWREDELVAIK